MTEFTPRPWYAIDRSPERGLTIRGGSHHYPIASCKSYYTGPGARSDEALANCDLIAAAPDLYAACAAAEDFLAASSAPGAQEIYAELHIALAKARGETA